MDDFEREPDKKVKFQQIFDTLDIEQRKTKICVSLGPSCWDVDMQSRMVGGGMDVVKINMANGDHNVHRQAIDNLRTALMQQAGKNCGIMVELKGTALTTGSLENKQNPIEYDEGQTIKVCTNENIITDTEMLAVTYKNLCKAVSVGSMILIDDDKLKLEVTEVCEDYVIATVKNKHKLGEYKTVRLPGATLELPPLSEKDEDDILNFALKHEIDYLCASSVRKASDIDFIREVLVQNGSNSRIIAKINSHEALNNFDDILTASDGIVVCRADLQKEIPVEKVYIAQKWMIEKCNLAAKSIFIMSQTFDSMIKAPRPVRSESQDICNVVVDGADVIILGDECSNGDYPLNAVSMLAKTVCEAEKTINYKKVYDDINLYTAGPVSNAETIAQNACAALFDYRQIVLIICITDSGKIARLIAKYKPEVKILVGSNDQTVSQLSAVRGVIGTVVVDGDFNTKCAALIDLAKEQRFVKIGQKVVVVQSDNEDTESEHTQFHINEVQ